MHFALFPVLVAVLAQAPAAALSPVQVSGLAHEIALNTPEQLHFAKRTTFKWVLFSGDGISAYPALSDRVFELLRTKYVVYSNEADIPAASIVTDSHGMKAYSGGFSFNVSLIRLGKNSIEVEYSDWEAFLAASSHTIQYRWNGRRWVIVKKGSLQVS